MSLEEFHQRWSGFSDQDILVKFLDQFTLSLGKDKTFWYGIQEYVQWEVFQNDSPISDSQQAHFLFTYSSEGLFSAKGVACEKRMSLALASQWQTNLRIKQKRKEKQNQFALAKHHHAETNKGDKFLEKRQKF